MPKPSKILLQPIGIAKTNMKKMAFQIVVHEEFRPALKELEQFTHVNVLWWAHKSDTSQQREVLQVKDLPSFYGKNAPTMGVFATRSEYRPNPLALTAAQILSVDVNEGVVKLGYFDAEDGTPILDLKPYLPMTDRISSAGYPPYLQHWPNSLEEAAEWWSTQFPETS